MGEVNIVKKIVATLAILALLMPSVAKANDEHFVPKTSGDKLYVVNDVLLVNKKYSLPSDYNPPIANGAMLYAPAQKAFLEMRIAALKAGLNLQIVSGYRSYDYQNQLFEQYRANFGDEAAHFSATPGQSEHQTGLAADIGEASYIHLTLEQSFANTQAGKWLAANSTDYGFILRYTKGDDKRTGYMYEPWHFRYVGKKVAKEMKALKIKTLEDYLGVSDGAGRKVATPLYYQVANNETLKKVKLFNIAGKNYLLVNDFMDLANTEMASLYIESHDENQYLLTTIKPEIELATKKLVLKPQKSGLRTAVPTKSNLKLNGIELKSKAYFIDNNLYISLGDFAQNLGYQVKLDKKEKQLSLEWAKETAFTKGVVLTEPVV